MVRMTVEPSWPKFLVWKKVETVTEQKKTNEEYRVATKEEAMAALKVLKEKHGKLLKMLAETPDDADPEDVFAQTDK